MSKRIKKVFLSLLCFILLVLGGKFYMDRMKVDNLYRHGFQLYEEQIAIYLKEHYSGISKIEFSPIYVTGDDGSSMLNAYVRPTIYDKYGHKATLGKTIENYTPNSYGLVTHIILNFDGGGNEAIDLKDSNGNNIDVSNAKHLPDEAKLTKARSTDENISLLVQDGQLKDVVKDEKGSPEAEIIYNVKLSKEEG